MINQRVETVTPANDYQLVIRFTNAEEKVFDMKPYLDKGVFKALRDDFFFRKAHVCWGTVVWDDDVDMGPDTLYLESRVLN